MCTTCQHHSICNFSAPQRVTVYATCQHHSLWYVCVLCMCVMCVLCVCMFCMCCACSVVYVLYVLCMRSMQPCLPPAHCLLSTTCWGCSFRCSDMTQLQMCRSNHFEADGHAHAWPRGTETIWLSMELSPQGCTPPAGGRGWSQVSGHRYAKHGSPLQRSHHSSACENRVHKRPSSYRR
jgi:hypothetical protein